jgi:hypothetical protein
MRFSHAIPLSLLVLLATHETLAHGASTIGPHLSGRRVLKSVILGPSVAGKPSSPCGPSDVRTRARLGSTGITGRYRAGDDILFLAACGDTIAVSPVLWTSIEYTLRVGPDSFAVYDRPARTIVILRDQGRIVGVRTTGFGISASFRRELPGAAPLPIEHLLFDSSGATAEKLLTSGPDASAAKAAALTDAVFTTFPTRRSLVVDVLRHLVQRWPTNVALARQEAEGLAVIGDSAAARAAADRAHQVAPSDTGLRRIVTWLDGGRALPDTGWRLDFPSESVLAPPTSSELATAWQAIAKRDRSARAVTVMYRGGFAAHGDSFTVTMVAHESGGQTHVGAIVAPAVPLPGCCATIIDIKGTNPGYRPLQLDGGPPALRLLGSAARNFIFVVPAIRGETIHFAGQDFRADGDRTDGWDGAADDALTLLAAAASIDSRVDPARACAYGRSRGGGVALLVAERDSRVRCVVAIAPPVDWFDAMWANGWPKATILRVALRTHAGPFAPGGQFIEWVLAPVTRGERSLAGARQLMIGMSALYYADRLPPTLAFFGAEDLSVPSRNAVLLDSALGRLRPSRGDRSLLVAPMAGHDADPAEVVRLVPAFFSRYLGTPVGQRWPGADAR